MQSSEPPRAGDLSRAGRAAVVAGLRTAWLAAAFALAAPGTAGARAEATPVDDRTRFQWLCERVAAAYDSARGGFVGRDGVPVESAVELGLLLGREREGAWWRSRALATLEWTRALMDTVSGGFATRRERSGAEGATFLMRTDVNALRLANLVAAWRLTGDDRHRRDAERVAAFVDRVLLDGRGGFVSAPVGDRTLEPAANGIAIHAWLTWAAATGEARLRDFALKSIERVWETCYDVRGVLVRRGHFGEITEAPQLADQVEMGRALVLAAQLCARPGDLERARGLGRMLLEKFEDPQRAGFRTQAKAKKDGSMRRAARAGEENARAARFLGELAAATGDTTFRQAARRTWAGLEKDQKKAGLEAADWALAVRSVLEPMRVEPVQWKSPADSGSSTPRILFRSGGKK